MKFTKKMIKEAVREALKEAIPDFAKDLNSPTSKIEDPIAFGPPAPEWYEKADRDADSRAQERGTEQLLRYAEEVAETDPSRAIKMIIDYLSTKG